MSRVSKAGPREYMGYVRVSQLRGREQSGDRFHSPDMQVDRIKEAVARADGTYADYRYDPDKSGYQKNVVREGWNEAVAWVMEDPTRRGIVAYDTSRLSRNLWKLLGDVQHTIVPAGGRVIVAGEGIDTVQPNWEMQLQMTGMIAEQFSRKVGERWDEVHQRRIRRKQSPVGKVPYGYRRRDGFDPETGESLGIEPDPDTADVVRRMYRMYLDGEGLRGICQRLNADGVRAPRGGDWSTTTLARILRNPASVGRFVFRGVETEGGWEPLIDSDTWEKFQRTQSAKATAPVANRRRTDGWVLSGIAKCASCGANLTVNYLPIEFDDERDDSTLVPIPKAHARRIGREGEEWTAREDKEYRNNVSTAMCTTYRSKGSGACTGVFMKRVALETQFTFFLGTLADEVARATTGKAAEAREAARTDAQRRADEARGELDAIAEARVDLAEQKALRQVDEATHRAVLRRLEARAATAREALAEAEAGIDAAEPLGEVWEQVASGGAGMTPAEWSAVLRRVVPRVEVSDESLLFVPSVGEPVEWARQSVARGAAVRGAKRRHKSDPDAGAVFPKAENAESTAARRERRARQRQAQSQADAS